MHPLTKDSPDKHHKRRWPLLSAVLAVVAAGLLLLSTHLLDANTWRDQLGELIGTVMKGHAGVGSLDWGIDNGIWLQADSLDLTDARLLPIDLSTDRVYLRLALAPLLQGELVFEQISIERPRLTVRLVPSADGSDSGNDAEIPVKIQLLQIAGGRLLVQDQLDQPVLPSDIRLSELDLELRDLAARAQTWFTLNLRLDSDEGENLGRLKGQGNFQGLTESFGIENPQLGFHAKVSELDARAQSIFLPPAYRLDTLAGKVSADIDYQGDFGEQGALRGKLELEQVSYREPSLWPKSLVVAGSDITFQLQLDSRQLAVEQLDLVLGNTTVAASGVIQDWTGEPLLQNAAMDAQLPLAEVDRLIPWTALGQALPLLKDVVQGGGTVTIDNITLPQISLVQAPTDWAGLLNKIDARVRLSGLSAQPLSMLPRIEHISGDLALRGGTLEGHGISARIGPLGLPMITVQASELVGQPRISATAKGPLQLAASSDQDIQALLAGYGLKNLTGSAEVDFAAHYDHAHPTDWDAKGSAALEQLQLTTLDSNSLIELHGKLFLRREGNLDLLLEDLIGAVNGSPLALHGSIQGIGSSSPLLDLEVQSKDLDLAKLAELVPTLQAIQLAGILNANLSIFYSHDEEKLPHLKGSLAADGLQLNIPDSELRLRDLQARLALSPGRLTIGSLAARLNDQRVAVDGLLNTLPSLSGNLHLSSPNLDLDQLLPADDPEANASTVASETTESSEEKQLPEFLRSASLLLRTEVARGQYRGTQFNDLDLRLDYHQGHIARHRFECHFDSGTLGTGGSADLNDLESIPFDIQYHLDDLKLEKVLPMAGAKSPTMSGLLNSKGQLQGRTGDGDQLLRSLRGQLGVKAGPGKIPGVGNAGKGLFNLLTLFNVEGLVKGEIGPTLTTTGIPYDKLDLDARFEETGMEVDQVTLVTPAINAEGTGLIVLDSGKLDMDLTITTLGTLDKLLGMVPLVGSTAANVTRTYLELKGTLDHPAIKIRPAKGFIEAQKKDSANPGGAIMGSGVEDIKDSVAPGQDQ